MEAVNTQTQNAAVEDEIPFGQSDLERQAKSLYDRHRRAKALPHLEKALDELSTVVNLLTPAMRAQGMIRAVSLGELVEQLRTLYGQQWVAQYVDAQTASCEKVP